MMMSSSPPVVDATADYHVTVVAECRKLQLSDAGSVRDALKTLVLLLNERVMTSQDALMVFAVICDVHLGETNVFLKEAEEETFVCLVSQFPYLRKPWFVHPAVFVSGFFSRDLDMETTQALLRLTKRYVTERSWFLTRNAARKIKKSVYDACIHVEKTSLECPLCDVIKTLTPYLG